jgi:hypothetical protein
MLYVYVVVRELTDKAPDVEAKLEKEDTTRGRSKLGHEILE